MAKDKYYGKTLRKNFARHEEVMAMPNLLEIQKKSYQWFLDTGLREVFADVASIGDYAGNLELSFIDYSMDEKPKYDVEECKARDATYAAPMKVSVRLHNKETGEIKVNGVLWTAVSADGSVIPEDSLVRIERLEGAKVYVIDDAELDRVKNNYPVMWKDKNATPKLCFVGCPHLSYDQLVEWTENVCESLKKNGRSKVSIPTVFTAAPAVVEKFNATPNAAKLKATGVVLSYICPLMYMNNPLAGKMPVITNSNKLRTYTTSRYYTSAEILDIITKEAK